jgi:DNA polymerase
MLHLDFETRSEIELDERGLDNYARDPTTQVLLAAYAFDDQKPKLWQPHLNPKIPEDLEDALSSPFVEIHAWNAPFEHAIINHVLKIPKLIREFRDPMVMARYLSLPGKLEKAGEILGLSEDQAKIEDGSRLIKLFCSPEEVGGKLTLFGVSEPAYRDWRTDPTDWKRFCEYCIRDVIAERAMEKKLTKFPLPEFEWETWVLGEKVNSTGWPIDMDVVRGARYIVEKEIEKLSERLTSLTGLANSNSGTQLLPWLKERGYGFNSLDKTFVARAMAGECDLTEDAEEVLIIRGQTSKSSVKKYTNIADMVSGDGRLRHQYTFMGAARTGRWAAHGVNVGNLPKPVKSVEKRMELAIELVRKMDYEGVKREFEKPLDVITSTVRASFRAPEGHKLVTADLSSIENVGAGFLSRSEPVLRVFKENRDPYLDFATHFYRQPYAELEAEFKAGDKSKRTMCKPASLGSGFGLGPGREKIDPETGQKSWEGLLAYARAMGVVMSQEEATKAIEVFRSVYPEIPRTWRDLEKAAKYAVRHPGKLVGVGVPQSERDREWFEEKGRKIHEPILSFLCHGTKVLELKLPSGRSLHYIDPKVEQEEFEWNGKKINGDKISYYGKEQNSTHWGRVPTHGGKIFENADQAWARDILVNGMHEADKEGFSIVGSTYDELITVVPENSRLTVDLLCECMTRKPWWMPEGIPLKAAGYESKEYKKD